MTHSRKSNKAKLFFVILSLVLNLFLIFFNLASAGRASVESYGFSSDYRQRSLAKRSFAQRTRGAKFGAARSAAERLANVMCSCNYLYDKFLLYSSKNSLHDLCENLISPK